MEQSFDILTTVVSGTAVLLLVVTAIHASARLLQMTFGKKSGLNRKDTAKSNKAVKNTEPANLPEKKEEPPGIDKQCAIYKEKYLTCKPLAKRAHVCIEQENVSLIKNYRSQFQDVLTRGTPEQLIERVEARARELQAQSTVN